MCPYFLAFNSISILDLKEHRRIMERLKKTIDFVQRILPAQHLGLFLLKQNRMRDTILPVPMSILTEETYTLPL